MPKTKTSKTNDSAPSIADAAKKVDIHDWIKKDTHEDPRINSLLRVIRWQGRFNILLILIVIIAIAIPFLDIELEVPNQKALQSAPPIELEDIDYNALAFQGDRRLTNGSTVSEPKITLLGQIYDGKQVMKQWPEMQFLVNNAATPITGSNSQFKIVLNLQPGPNIIETSFRLNGVLHNRRQRVINYEPKSATSTHEAISTQTTLPSGR
ncbi:hypothetical protein GF391_01340 [Candidatus Uhrbacteria bacterium]|nr:hypothetical protein [Candidatus Uhrbacteria bacterium]